MVHLILAVAFVVLITTPWMGNRAGLFDRVTNVYMALYLTVLVTVASLTGPTALVTAGFLAPAAAWLSADALYTTPSLRPAALTAVTAGVGFYAAGYAATATVTAVGWTTAIPVLVTGYAGWLAYLLATRQRTQHAAI